MEDLLDQIKRWIDPPGDLSQEHAYFHAKVVPLFPDIVQTITDQRKTLAQLSLSLRNKDAETENLKARIDMLQGELGEARSKLAEQQPTIAALNDAVWRAIKTLEVVRK